MSESDNSQKTEGSESVRAKTSGQKSVSKKRKRKNKNKSFPGDRVVIYSLMVAVIGLMLTVIGLMIGIMLNNTSQNNATRTELIERIDKNRDEMLTKIDKNKTELLAEIESLRSDVRAGFAQVGTRFNSNDGRIDNLYRRDDNLSLKRDEEYDSLEDRVSSLESKQTGEN